MARVLISKATLADFGVPRQDVAVRPPMPNEQQIRDAVLGDETMGLLSPEQYGMRMPLIDRNQESSGDTRLRERNKEGQVGEDFLRNMGLEGALASGIAMREFPAIGMEDHHEVLPFLRDYYGRQTTLPEHDWGYHTEGPYYDEEGNILPGQVPPVNAIKLMNRRDINHVGRGSGFGLKPLPYSKINQDWERTVREGKMFPAENIGFVGPTMEQDIKRNSAANTGRGRGYVGVRGFGRPSDKAFARDSGSEGREAGFTSAIPPERLVGAMPSSTSNISWEDEEYGDLITPEIKPTIVERKTREQMVMEAMEDGIISPTDVPLLLLQRRAYGGQYPYAYEEGKNSDNDPPIYFTQNMTREIARPNDAISHRYQRNLPLSWEDGHFGLENPILTEAEKADYIRQIQEQMGPKRRKDIEEWTDMDTWNKRNPVLHPKTNKVQFV